MERLALIVVLAIASTGASCQTAQDRVSTAVSVQAVVRNPPKPDLPASCTALMERVKPRVGEAWVIFARRWEIVADNRDQQTADCKASWDAFWASYSQSITKS
jgi:hypothetical protein